MRETQPPIDLYMARKLALPEAVSCALQLVLAALLGGVVAPEVAAIARMQANAMRGNSLFI
jgi:hypothetical protein